MIGQELQRDFTYESTATISFENQRLLVERVSL